MDLAANKRTGRVCMATIREHYESLLAEHYTWMLGMAFRDKVAEQRALFLAMQALPERRELAIDLGSGPGFQAIALAELGFERVEAIDLSPTLLAELARNKDAHPIRTFEADLNAYLETVSPGAADLIVCMGDTLTHLVSRAEVTALFRRVASALGKTGRFALTYRDLSDPLTGVDRFFDVAADDQRILTCFLEYKPYVVLVHDLFHQREGATWTFKTSSYPKLRLPVDWQLRSAGFSGVARVPAGRLTGVVARKS